MSTRFLYLLPQILPQILHRLSKNSFRENRFIFSDGPEDPSGKEAETARATEAAKEAEKDKDKKKEVVVATGEAETAKAADATATREVQPDPIDKELSALDQAKFDQLMEKINKGSLERTITPAQVETLVTFAKTNEPQKNLKTLFAAISESKITADQLNLNSVKIMVEHVQSDPAKFTKLFAILSKSSTPASYMLEATADNPTLLKEAYASIRDNQVIITNLSLEGLTVLVNKIDLTDLLGKLTVDQKTACLINAKVDNSKKELILENLISAKANLAEYMTNVTEAIISYILEKSPKHLGTTLTQKLDEASIKKLSYMSAKTLIEKTFENKDCKQIYDNILKNIQAPTKGAIIDDKIVKLKIRLALYDTLTDEEKKGFRKPGEEPEAKTETFTKDTDLKQRIEKADLKLVKQGKSVGWSFNVLDKDGLMTTSERSFLKTKKFLKELNKTDDKGELIYNTPDKVKLCAYKWLWEKVYKDGKVKKSIGKVEEFQKSQEQLQQEITRLEAIVNGEPAPKAEKTTSPASAAEPAKSAKTGAPAPKDGAVKPPATVEPAAKGEDKAPAPAAPKSKLRETLDARDAAGRTLPTETPVDSGTTDRPKPAPKEAYKQAKEKLNERIQKKLEEIRAIATATADTQTEPENPEKHSIKIIGPTKEIAEGQYYSIEIDGKTTPFTLEIAKDFHTEKVAFTFKMKPYERTEYKEFSKEEVAAKFIEMLNKTPNERPVKDFDKAVTDLQSVGYGSKIEYKEPKALTVNQFKTIQTGLESIKMLVEGHTNLFELLEGLKKEAAAHQPILANASITKIRLNTKPQIVWNPQSKEVPFGEEDKLVDAILLIKEKQFGGQDTDEYRNFIEKTKTKESEVIRKSDAEQRAARYREKYKELTDKTYDLKIGDLSEEEMVSNWKRMNGHIRVQNIMKNSPFSFNQDGEIAKKAAEIISKGSNSEVAFAEVFKSIKDVTALRSKGLIVLIEKGPEEFMEIFDKLLKAQEKGELTNKSNQEQLELMFKEVLIPCLDLLKAFEKLEPPKETKKEEKEKTEELPEEQKQIMESLSKLCNFNDSETGSWSKFLVWMSGGKGQITMSDIDGNTFTVPKGKFHDRYSPKAALAILTNINEDKNKDGAPDHYTFDEKGNKMLNKKTILSEINDRIILGVTNMVMAEAGQKDSPLASKDLSTEIKMRLVDYLVIDLKNITPDQIKAFQLGFVLKEARQFAEKVAEAKQAVAESSENPTIKNHPLFRQMAGSLLDQGISPGKVKSIQEKALFAAGASFKNGKFEGAGIGTKIDIGDGMSVLIGLGATTDGKVVAGVGLSITIYKGDTVEASFIAEIGLTGATLGSAQTTKAGEVKIHTFEGFRWSWDSIIPTVGGSFGLSWNMDKQLEKDMKAAEGKTDYSKVWDEWKRMPQSDIDGKYAKLQQIPRLYRPIEAIKEEFGLSKIDVINIVEGIKDQLTADVMKKLDSPVPLFSYVGFGMLGPIPIPQVGFKLGSAEITIPNRRAIAKILSELSDIRVTKALEKAVAEIDKGEKTPVFVEQTGKLVYGRDGKLMNLLKREQIDFKNFQTGIETYNAELKRAEMKLIENPNGTIELKVLGTDMKDVEIHIDPKLTELTLVKDGSSILLEGNIDDLVISRERFGFPFEITDGSASMRDVITIRQTGSLRGKRDANWIQTHESAFFQKLEDESEFSIQTGNNDEHKQDNIFESDGYGKKSAEELAKVEKAPGFIAKRAKLEGRLDAKQAEELGKQTDKRHEALEKRGSAMKLNEYEKLKVRDNLFDDLTKIFPKKNEFTKEFRSQIDDTEALAQILAKYSDKIEELKNLNEKEINLAITHLVNIHFTNVYQEATRHKPDGSEELNEKEIKRINRGILRGMEKKIKFVKDKVLLPKFEESIAKMDPKPSTGAKELVDKLINDTYNPLREKLKDPTFDFRQIKVEQIPAGAYLFSGSRLYEKGKVKGALAENVSYETLPKEKQLLLGFGFLEGTTGSYDLKSANQQEKDLARVILEISSPIPKDDIEFLESPLALKFAGLNTGILLSFNEGSKFDDYQKITEVYANTSLLQTSPAHKEAVGRFRDLINDIRKYQLDGSIFEKRIGDTGLTVKIKMNTNINRGSYSKCTNPSFYVQESAEISILAKGGKVVAEFNSTNEVIDAKASKIFASFGIGIGFRSEKVPPPKPPGPKPEAGPGGSVDQHGGGTPPKPTEGTGSQAGQGGGGDSTGSSGSSTGSVGSDEGSL